MFYYVLCSLVVCLWICGSQGTEYNFEIIRRRQDIFKNFDCQSFTSEECSCEYYNAECVNLTCEYCRCSESHNTFMVTDYDPNYAYGVCTRDEEIVPTSVPFDATFLENLKYGEYVKSNSENNYISGTKYEEPSNHHNKWPTDMLWIFTDKGGKRLSNVKTLKCVQRIRSGTPITMEQCSTKSNRQKIQCIYGGPHKKKIKLKGSNQFMHLPNSSANVISKNAGFNSPAQIWEIDRTSCTTAAYEGCYRFSDGSFMKYLNYSEKNLKLQISAPIFKDDGNCEVEETFEYNRDGWNWEITDGGGSLFSMQNKNSSTKVLTIESVDLFRKWNGSLVKLYISCPAEEHHCVLFKLQTLSRKHSSEGSTAAALTTKRKKDTPSVTSTTGNSNLGLSEQSSGKKTDSTVVPVSVTITLLLAALAVAIGVLVYYRRRKRAQVPPSNANNLGIVNYNKEIYEDPDRNYERIKEDATSSQTVPTNSATGRGLITNTISPDYETLKENGNEVSFNRPRTSYGANTHKHGNNGANTDIPRKPEETKMAPVRGPELYHTLEQPPSDDLYNYIDNTKIKNPSASPELEYTYSKDTDIPKNPQQTRVAPKGPAVYETLENPSSDDVYNYIDNANIAKPVTSEQEYTYATDTNLPRAGQNREREPPASDAVYHTLEQDQPLPSSSEISSEMEYSYAKSTDLPRKPLATNDDEYCITDVSSMGVQQNSTGSCVPPTDNDLYHTLEDPNQPNVPVYSTLEEGDAENA